MRKRITLYIGGNACDLADDDLVIFNYTLEDLSNPTIVKNSFSRQIVLKGTPTNNRIFGEVFRVDRRVGSAGGAVGADFNPSLKVPFAIYDELSQIIESGYVKLNTVTREGHDIEYAVTLYGGLGSFLYALSYDAEGNKRTLADLDYLGTGNSETELDFLINATNVAAAWAATVDTGNVDSIWKVINFAPCYNGIPDGNFLPDKGLIMPHPDHNGLEPTYEETEGEGEEAVTHTYTTRGGFSVVNLANAVDEWAVKDLRSYLQRPVFSMRSFFKALARPENVGGYAFDTSIVDDAAEFPYGKTWLTLPMLPTLATLQKQTGELEATLSSSAGTSMNLARYDITGSVAGASKIAAALNLSINLTVTGSSGITTMHLSHTSGRTAVGTLIFLQPVCYDSNNVAIGGGPVKVVTTYAFTQETTVRSLADAVGYTPAYAEGGYDSRLVSGAYTIGSTTAKYLAPDLAFSASGPDVDHIIIKAAVFRFTAGATGNIIDHGALAMPYFYDSDGDAYAAASWYAVAGVISDTITYTTPDALVSNCTITKSMLLSTTRTPAEYLLSFCKVFGLLLRHDPATGAVTLMRRDDFYQDNTIDLTGRVDLSRPRTITPLAFNAKWYKFALEAVESDFMEQYRNVHGNDYGIQRVDTGYDFDADEQDLLQGNVFRNAAAILGRSKYMYRIQRTGVFYQSPFLDSGNTYTLWEVDNEDVPSVERPIGSIPATASFYPYNSTFEGYDSAEKPEFRDAENKPVDGEDVLLVRRGTVGYYGFQLTDDVTLMDTLVGGPCWRLQDGNILNTLTIPVFSRYEITSNVVTKSLDLGAPSELGIPGLTYDAETVIYRRAWRAYIADRYDVNTKVLRCWVDMRGLKVDADLLRNFYYYGGSLWALNSIVNYSLTTPDPVECEFVQVQDKSAYLAGQYQ